MTSTKKNLIIIISIFALIILLFVIVMLSGKITMNDENTVGNTAGNINNSGLFCESEDKVFFSNAYDNNALYCMNPDETEMKKLNGNSVSLINSGGKYIYYYMESSKNGKGLGFMGRTAGIYRSDMNGKHTICLDRAYTVSMQLCGNYIYYLDNNGKKNPQLNKIKIDRSDKTSVADYIINPASYVNGRIYFNGTQNDHALYSLNTSNDNISSVWNGNIWNPVYQDGYIYYMDVANDYRLCRYSLSDNVVEVLTNDRVDHFNVYDYYIYYQKNSKTEPALKRMIIDGSYNEVIADGNYENINITSQYVYFNMFGESVPVYKTATYGGPNVTTFEAARNAAAENMK